jgi:hypothetical protein
MATDGTSTTKNLPAGLPSSAGPAAPAISAGLSDSEMQTLKRTLALIKAARSDATSNQPNVANAAKRRLIIAFGYLLGFFDGKGMIPAMNPGYTNVFGSQGQPDLASALDQIQQTLEDALDPTRIAPLVIGAVLLGAALYAVGAYLLSD